MQKSPTYWETLIKMTPAALEAAFNQCAKIDLSWAIDQARIVALQSGPAAEQSTIARTFCAQAAQKLQHSDPKAALEALQVAADVDHDEKAATLLKETLQNMADGNLETALGCAVLLRARCARNSSAHNVLTDFLIMTDGEDQGLNTGGMLMTIITHSEAFTPEQMDKILERLERFAAQDPGKYFDIRQELSGYQDQMTEKQLGVLDIIDQRTKAMQTSGILVKTKDGGITDISSPERIGGPYVFPTTSTLH